MEEEKEVTIPGWEPELEKLIDDFFEQNKEWLNEILGKFYRAAESYRDFSLKEEPLFRIIPESKLLHRFCATMLFGFCFGRVYDEAKPILERMK
ncbi:MAG: hypothetical protein ACTSV7_14380 [Candidatus Baldrarchaeia archaeon]